VGQPEADPRPLTGDLPDVYYRSPSHLNPGEAADAELFQPQEANAAFFAAPSANMRVMPLPARRSGDRSLTVWEGRARVALSTRRRAFSRVWTAPRSPAQQVLIVPLLLCVALVIVAVGLIAILIGALALAVAAVVVLVATPFSALAKRSRGRTPGPPGS
jgi:hypothetical protein